MTLSGLRKLSSAELVEEVIKGYGEFYPNLEPEIKVIPHNRWGLAIVERGKDGTEFQHPFNGDGSSPLTNKEYNLLVNLGLIDAPYLCF